MENSCTLLCNYYIRILGKVEKILGRTDSPGCGRATAVASVHWTLAKSRLSNPSTTTKIRRPEGLRIFVVGEDGFEPSKRNAADLQSVPFGHSGTPPYELAALGAGRRTRTPDLLITNQLLYQLSYTGVSNRTRVLYHGIRKCQELFLLF